MTVCWNWAPAQQKPEATTKCIFYFPIEISKQGKQLVPFEQKQVWLGPCMVFTCQSKMQKGDMKKAAQTKWLIFHWVKMCLIKVQKQQMLLWINFLGEHFTFIWVHLCFSFFSDSIEPLSERSADWQRQLSRWFAVFWGDGQLDRWFLFLQLINIRSS